MSDYRPTSEVMKLCDKAEQGPVKVSDDLLRVLVRAEEISRLSDGAFDVTAGPLVKLWREARRTGKMPAPEAIAAAKALVNWKFVKIDRRAKTVEILKKGVRIDFGGIAKGDACDQATMVLKKMGIKSSMVESGGDLVVTGPPPGQKGWAISVNGLRRGPLGNLPVVDGVLTVANAAVSTSGDTEQFVEIEGVRYSHIVDTKTGYGLTNRAQVTILAPQGLASDPLSKVFAVLGMEKGLKVAAKFGARAGVLFAER